MTARQRRLKRRSDIIAVANQIRLDYAVGGGLDPQNYERDQLFEIIKDCASLAYLTDPEQRLAVVAFEEGITAAKNSIWYK